MWLADSTSIVFLDEPTTGLDPRRSHPMWQIIRDLVAGGVTILLTTQHPDEAEVRVRLGRVLFALVNTQDHPHDHGKRR